MVPCRVMVRSGKLLRVAMVAAAVACGASEVKRLPSSSCGPIGKSQACACADGRTGAQICREDGAFGACACAGAKGSSGASGGGAGGGSGTAPSGGAAGSAAGGGEGGNGDAGSNSNTAGEGGSGQGGTSGGGGPTPDVCEAADVGGCRCGDRSGYRLCVRGTFGGCVCSGGSGGFGGMGDCVPEPEICNQLDDDCNEVADDHFACPDPSVSNTTPFDRGVYFLGSAGPNSDQIALQQAWPNFRLPYYVGFGSYAQAFVFRASDDALFYADFVRGIVMNGSGATAVDDVLQLTPPCGKSVGTDFGFDDSGTLHYRCGDTLRRGSGELVARNVATLAGVIGDGRTIVTRDVGGRVAYAVLSPSGEELSHFPPPDFFTGTTSPLPGATTVNDETGYVAVARHYEERDEIVGYLVDSESNWRFVRRVIVADLGESQLLLSDGTLLVEEWDGVSAPGYWIRAHLPDGKSRIVWREAEAIYVRPSVWHQLLVGPHQP